MRAFVILAAGAFALAGCQTQQQAATPNKVDQIIANAKPASPAVKAALIEGAREALKDPYSIRDPQISFVVKPFPDQTIEVVCVRYNAKNDFGGYSGRTAMAVRLKNSQIIAWRQEDPVCYHPAVRWYPFPEVKRLQNL